MSQESPRNEIRRATVRYEVPGMDDVAVRHDVEYAATDEGALTMDLYLPPGADGAAVPAVVLVSGYPDPGYEAVLGCKFKETGWSVSWGRLLAASGLAAVTYTNHDPIADLDRLLDHLRGGDSPGIDVDRLALSACSGNVPRALAALMDSDGALACATLSYGFTLDAAGSTHVADAAAQFRFVNPCAGRTVADLPDDLPIHVVRAGADEMPGLNAALDRFTADALDRNLPLTVVNLAASPHAFDLHDDSEASRATIRQSLDFLRAHLLGVDAGPTR